MTKQRGERDDEQRVIHLLELVMDQHGQNLRIVDDVMSP